MKKLPSPGVTRTNLLTSLLLQGVTILCGFILPRLVLTSFGSEYNGIIHSVDQFLSCVTLLRAGIGGVTRAALYKPLADRDMDRVSAIVWATERFMRKIAWIFTGALVAFACLYPLLVQENFGWLFTFTLVLTLGSGIVIQYYFGITYQFLLHADQKLYVYNLVQTAAVVLNTLGAVILIRQGMDIRIVKLASAACFAITPLFLYGYVHKHYALNREIPADNSTITQRWDAFAHQVAAFVHSNTDFMVLTAFSTLYEVSVYSVYNMVVNGVRSLILTGSSAIEAMFGRMMATGEKETVEHHLSVYEYIVHILAMILLGCTAVLITPFAAVYTGGVSDACYHRPVFGWLLSFAAFLSCVRLPYQNLVEAAGHFRQTRNGAIGEAVLNLSVSVMLVGKYGCEGVAIGTTAAMLMRTVQYGWYVSVHMLDRSPVLLVRRALVDVIAAGVWIFAIRFFGISQRLALVRTYSGWILGAVAAFALIAVVTAAVNCLCYPALTAELLGRRKR